jgi:hypothetical protein
MKKVKWMWDWECYVPFCPYCYEIAYEKDHCVFCKKEYKWVDKSKIRKVTVGKYTVVQASNKHITIMKDGEIVIEHGTQDTGLVCYFNFTEDGKSFTIDCYSTLLGKFLKYEENFFTLDV